ncbi:hypothetical protein AYR66_17365 [Noviherbaspirillum denitrificans]|uniref:Uncharacterized protein n=1 Tax=Noviherbaspirillum denitrificans TaxID=1968433 RepID=A0A254TEE8_9BURK|nr:hypothetical protein AYR66_17365 [Noviherbaspirillum denitrificans]
MANLPLVAFCASSARKLIRRQMSCSVGKARYQVKRKNLNELIMDFEVKASAGRRRHAVFMSAFERMGRRGLPGMKRGRRSPLFKLTYCVGFLVI